jgi:hypothetical protein
MSLRVLTPREASIFACVCDTIVAPEPALPAVRDTDAVVAFDRLLAAAPRMNRVALRGLLYAAELGPRALGRRRLRRLSPRERGQVLDALDHASAPSLRQLAALVKSIACLSYYGDDAVARRLGWDADAVIARAADLRAREGRP